MIEQPFGTLIPLDELLPPLLDGTVTTLRITVFSALLGVGLAILAGLGRAAPSRFVRFVASVYVEFFRGTSVVIQLFWFYFALPAFGVQLTADEAGVLALGLNMGAYGAEVVRGAITAVPRGQIEAATVLNLGPARRFLHVVWPQALPRMIPPFNNLLIELLKGTALVSLITLSDLTFEAQKLRTSTGETLEVFGTILVIYFLIALAITAGMRALERKVAIPGQARTGS